MSHDALLIDIGRTDCRISMMQQLQGGRPRFAHNYELSSADFPTIEAALEHYMSLTGITELPKAIGIAVMGIVRGRRNERRWATWNISEEDLQQKLGFETVVLVNDVAALASSLPWLSGREVQPLFQLATRHETLVSTGRYAIINSNEGLGVAALTHTQHGYEIIDSEAGHMGYAPQTPMEIEILKRLAKTYDRVTYEHVLSMPGLVNVYRSICEIRDVPAYSMTGLEIVLYGHTNADAICRETLEVYFSNLGVFAGDVAINLGAESGIFLSSAVVLKTGDYIKSTNFRDRFDSKGHMSSFVAGIPTSAIYNRSARLVGLARLVTDALLEKGRTAKSGRDLAAVFSEAMASVDQTVIIIDPEFKIITAMMADWYDAGEILKPGADFREALAKLDEQGLLGVTAESGGLAAILAKFNSGESFTVERNLFGGRVCEMLARPRDSGGYVVVEKDVTDLRMRTHELEDLARNLRAASSKAEAGSRAKSQFLANMSHEIRTPLNGVLGMADVLRRTPLASEQKDMLEIIISSGNGLLNVINDILDFSKIEAGKMRLVSGPFNLATLVEDVSAIFVAQAETKGLELMIRCRPNIPIHLLGDQGRLRQILTNVVGNAIKFTDHGHVYVDVDGRMDKGRAALTISISDTGCGIPADKLERVFEMFEQVDASASRFHDGTGLGLSISRRLLELMGGDIGVESVVGSGSTFTITLALPVSAQELPVVDDTESVDLAGQAVLIVDDKPINCQILEEQTKSWGMAPVCVPGGREALELLRSPEAGHFAVAILDYQMPGYNGVELARTLKHDPRTKALPLVLLTSVGHLTDMEELTSLFAAILVKPARSTVLRQKIAAIISGLRAEREADGEATPKAKVLEPARANPAPREPAAAVSAPVLASKPATVAPPAKAAPPESNNDPVKAIRILVADDNAVNHKLIAAMLANGGYEIAVAEDGRKAVDAYRATLPDLILMDVSMPRLDGLEATAEIRLMEKTLGRRATIVGVTAHAMPEDRQACIDAGMDDYLAKPINRDQLVNILRAHAC